MKSIMHKKGTYCYLCALLHGDYSVKQNLQEHHVIYGNGRRIWSERFGLKIYLCFRHHTYEGGPEAIHRNQEISQRCKEEAQRIFEETYPNLSFIDYFGKNYRIETDRQTENPEKAAGETEKGFWMIEE